MTFCRLEYCFPFTDFAVNLFHFSVKLFLLQFWFFSSRLWSNVLLVCCVVCIVVCCVVVCCYVMCVVLWCSVVCWSWHYKGQFKINCWPFEAPIALIDLLMMLIYAINIIFIPMYGKLSFSNNQYVMVTVKILANPGLFFCVIEQIVSIVNDQVWSKYLVKLVSSIYLSKCPSSSCTLFWNDYSR